MITVKKLTASIGAEIGGVDLSQPLSTATVAEIKQAYNDNLVVFFRNQKPLDDETHIRVGRYFGTLDISEIQPAPREHREVLVLDQVSPKGDGADPKRRPAETQPSLCVGAHLKCRLPGSGRSRAKAPVTFQGLYLSWDLGRIIFHKLRPARIP